MASPDRQETDSLIGKIRENPFRFDFFRSVRLLENQYRDQPRTGRSLSPKQDPVRFGQNPSLAFASSTLETLDIENSGRPPQLKVHFFGLLGPNGPLPAHLTEYARDRLRNVRDTTLASFFDLFHHRLISFFYRAWAINQKAVDYDRPDESKFANYIGSFFGLGDPAFRKRDVVPDSSKLHFAGRLAAQTRNAEGLQAILGDYFKVPAEIQSFRGHWLALPEMYQCQLGGSQESSALGVSTLVGTHTWDVQNRFRIRFGPMGIADLKRFLPNESAFERLKCWVTTYTTDQFWWDLQLVLKKEEVPMTCLGQGAMLGWTCWLKTKTFDQDADDLVIEPTTG